MTIAYIGEIPVFVPQGVDPLHIDPFQMMDAHIAKEFLPEPGGVESWTYGG